ncbi:ABC transporter permease, partial [Methylophaga sp. OBS4]|uniref:ABC transporter permease n=1 Tax=Methylophaga sp. OBS4 TaxID=2991935 RepID=UPI002252F78E
MLAYIVRRILYAFPILMGVNALTFVLFFMVNTPDDMARMHLGGKHVTEQAIESWKEERGYNKALIWNTGAEGLNQVTDTIFFTKSLTLFVFEFGQADDGRDIGQDIRTRMWPSLAIAVPVFVIGLLVNITFAMLMVFFRATYVDLSGVILCVVLMSISGLFYIIGGQFLVGKIMQLVPISGFGEGISTIKFLILPVVIGIVSGIGSGSRWYRTLFLEEVSKDYVRTARAKGLSEVRVLFS